MNEEKRDYGSVVMEIPHGDFQPLAAGKKDPVFGEFAPDAYSAFARVRLSKSLPMVMGPESVSGAVFGIHPAVIARSYETLRYKQTNDGHRLRMYGARQNTFVGCVLQVAFPEEPDGGWAIPDTVEQAPSILALSTLFKQEPAVKRILGEHQGTVEKQWAVSMEVSFLHTEMGIFDPKAKEAYDRDEIPARLRKYLKEDKDFRLSIRKGSDVPPLVLALGGVSKTVFYSGFGYTRSPAESTAGIEMIAAEKREGMMVCKLGDAPEWVLGMALKWNAPGGWGRGVIKEVVELGERFSYGQKFVASVDDPVLVCELPDGNRIIRMASTVRRP